MMHLPKFLHSTLLLTACIFVHCDSTLRDHQADEYDKSKRIYEPEKPAKFGHDKKRRDVGDRVGHDNLCARNETVFQTNGATNDCYYDHACFSIFSDCCPDYEERCGRQNLLTAKTSMWKCIEWNPRYHWPPIAFGPRGFWMISKCPADWSFSEQKIKCENISSNMSYPVEDFLPVVGADGLTYSNKHCAICNQMENYTFWNIGVFTYVTAPEEFDLDSRSNFILRNKGIVDIMFPEDGQPRRYCYGKYYYENCSSINDTSYKACVKGPIEVVTLFDLLFKNTACAICNGYPSLTAWIPFGRLEWTAIKGFLVIYKLDKTFGKLTTAVVNHVCPNGTIYDSNFHFCRKNYLISSSGDHNPEFFILLWLKQPSSNKTRNSTLEIDLKSALTSQFSLRPDKLSRISLHQQDEESHFLVASFRLTLTPLQTFIMANPNESNTNITRKNSSFLKLMNFTGRFSVTGKNCIFSVIKTVTKQLSCNGGKRFQPHEFKLMSGKLVVNSTNEIFPLNNYSLLEEENRGVILCHKKFNVNRHCTGNKTVFETLLAAHCYYDNACYEIFSDCCPDYEWKCGRQKLRRPTLSMWKCVKWYYRSTIIPGVEGFWMIYKCPDDWPFDEQKSKCENAPSEFSYPVEDFIPVVGANSLTYRNKHCALCNGVKNYTAWNIAVLVYVVPPERLDLDSRLKFILKHKGFINYIFPDRGQPRRYCFGENYYKNCTSTNHTFYKACVEGPTEVVQSRRNTLYFKNSACALCNEQSWLRIWVVGLVGSPVPEGFSIVFKFRGTGRRPTMTVVDHVCPTGTVYDYTFQFCREGYLTSSSDELSEFLLFLWFKPIKGVPEIDSTFKHVFKSALTAWYSLHSNQISTIFFHKQDKRNDIFVATFRLNLTPFQSLMVANPNEPKLNATRKNTAFLELLNSTGNVTVTWKNVSFSVIKKISKRLSCYGERKFRLNEYKTVVGKLVVNATGEIVPLNDYTFRKQKGGNITLCRKLVLSDCVKGAYVPVNPNNYQIFSNLSLYYKPTNTTFHFGEYLISESLNKPETSNFTFHDLRNTTIAICLRYKNKYSKTEIKYKYSSTSYALGILTAIGFSVSITCLILLLTTYGLFKELRTVPGLNLMNFSFSMMVSQFVWVVGTSHFTGTSACKGFAIAEHYLLQVSFLAMSVISHHTCLTLSNPSIGRIVNKSSRRFLVYLAFVWLIPAIVVAICITLDETEVFPVDYGTNCWMGTVNAKLYLFLLPLGILLLYNICRFIQTARGLSRHDKDRKMLKQKEEKQNLLICAKIATLVGFPWLFAFFGVLFPNVEAFEYLFVIFVCSQGLYIGMAFLFNKKTLKLYIDRWNAFLTSRENSSSRATGALNFEMT